MNEQFWLGAALERLAMEPPGGYTEPNHCLDAVVESSDAHSYVGTEQEAPDDSGYAWIEMAQELQHIGGMTTIPDFWAISAVIFLSLLKPLIELPAFMKRCELLLLIYLISTCKEY